MSFPVVEMKLKDVLYPERVVGAAFRGFLWVLALLLAGEFLQKFIAARSVSVRDLAVLFLIVLAASPIAYLVREKRHKRVPRKVSRRGAERKPVLPHDRGEA